MSAPGDTTGGRDIADRDDVERFVRDFYRQVAMDDVLGPVFEDARVDWPQHIATLTDFWAWQLLGDDAYDGNPLLAHRPAHARTPFTAAHYERWLQILDDTLDADFRGPVADAARVRGRKMAAALRRLLDAGPMALGGAGPVRSPR